MKVEKEFEIQVAYLNDLLTGLANGTYPTRVADETKEEEESDSSSEGPQKDVAYLSFVRSKMRGHHGHEELVQNVGRYRRTTSDRLDKDSDLAHILYRKRAVEERRP